MGATLKRFVAFTGNQAFFLTWSLTAAALCLLFWQAGIQEWFGHWQSDIGSAFDRSGSFINEGTWKNMTNNEYQPGALWYFVFLRTLVPHADQYAQFLVAMMFANALLMLLHTVFFLRYGHRWSGVLFLFLALAFGPVLLFRIELLVSLLTLCAWQCLRGERFTASAFLLGIAASVHIYLLVLLPLVLLETLRQRNRNAFAECILYALVGLLLPTAFFIACGGSAGQIFDVLRLSIVGPLSFEGFWGAIVTMLQQGLGTPIEVVNEIGGPGIRSHVPILTEPVIGAIWIGICAVVFGFIFFLRGKKTYADAGFAFLLVYAVAFFALHPDPQYVWWGIALLPLMPFSWLSLRAWVVVVTSLAVAFLLAQLIYPVYYNPFNDWYYGNGGPLWTFVLVVIRNALYLGVLFTMLWSLHRPRRA